MSTPNYSPSTSTLTNMPSILTEEGGIKLRSRISTVSQLAGSHQTMWYADTASNYARTVNQQMRDGVPPYNPSKERLLGLAGRANINWGLADQVATESEAPYNDLLEGIDNLCTMPTNWGDEKDRVYWESVMAEEFTRMLRSWRRFAPLWHFNVRLFVNEGVSFSFFEDDVNWEWEIKGLQHLVFERRTRADVESLDIVTCKVNMLPASLYRHCQNKEVAVEMGWNPDACLEALKQAASQHGVQGNDWQEWERYWKNNDIFQGETTVTVETIHGWVKEVDGTVTHLICRYDGQGEFLYRSDGKYRCMSSMLIPCLYGVGSNDDFHSIRGVLAKIAPSCAGINRVFNKMLDMAWISSSPVIETTNEDALTELPITPMGMFIIPKPGVTMKFIELQDFKGSLMPIMNLLQGFLGARSSSFTPTQLNQPDRTERTKYEKQMQHVQEGKLSTTGMNHFKGWLSMHLKEVARRVIRKGYTSQEPGGWAVTDFKARCIARGVPEEAIYAVDTNRMEVNMGIGAGSAMERQRITDNLFQKYYPYLDPEGKNRLINMCISSEAGASVARSLAPLTQGLRPPMDAEFAQLENNQLIMLLPVEVLPNQNHTVHLEKHIERLDQINGSLANGEATLEQTIPQMQFVFQHSETHFELISEKNPMRGQFKEALNNFYQVITNGAKQLATQQEKMMREAEHNAGKVGDDQVMGGNGATPQASEGTQPNSSTLVQAVEAGQKMRDANQAAAHGEETHGMKMLLDRARLEQEQLKAQKLRQELVLEDLKTAHQLSQPKAQPKTEPATA